MNRWIFLHVEKTGGKALCKFLHDHLGEAFQDCSFGRPQFRSQRFRTFVRHRRPEVRIIGGHDLRYGAHELLKWDRYHYFTYIRDPAERLWSQWHAERMWSKRGRKIGPFDQWIAGRTIRLCWCLDCFMTASPQHKQDPMLHAYASRGAVGSSPSYRAKVLLSRITVVPTEQITDWQARVLFPSLGLDPKLYQPWNVTGQGSKIPDDMRTLVYRLHPGDLDLWLFAKDLLSTSGISGSSRTASSSDTDPLPWTSPSNLPASATAPSE